MVPLVMGTNNKKRLNQYLAEVHIILAFFDKLDVSEIQTIVWCQKYRLFILRHMFCNSLNDRSILNWHFFDTLKFSLTNDNVINSIVACYFVMCAKGYLIHCNCHEIKTLSTKSRWFEKWSLIKCTTKRRGSVRNWNLKMKGLVVSHKDIYCDFFTFHLYCQSLQCEHNDSFSGHFPLCPPHARALNLQQK